MSDMEDDFMCDDEEDYDLVKTKVTLSASHACRVVLVLCECVSSLSVNVTFNSAKLCVAGSPGELASQL